jgi:hypothetical protein
MTHQTLKVQVVSIRPTNSDIRRLATFQRSPFTLVFGAASSNAMTRVVGTLEKGPSFWPNACSAGPKDRLLCFREFPVLDTSP